MDEISEQTIQQDTCDAPVVAPEAAEAPATRQPESEKENRNEHGPVDEALLQDESSAQFLAEMELIKNSQPTTELETALYAALVRKERHIAKITNELTKLRSFMTKRKQTYKRKRKDEGAPTRPLSAYNMFIKERFAELAKKNEEALKSEDSDAALKRVAPANLVAETGNAWKELSAEDKQKYEERAKADRLRYEEQMAHYQPPEKSSTRKRNKTGYNMFFSAHVLRLKQSEPGVPAERGSIARLVADTWKRLSTEERQFYEREADKHNDANPVDDEEEEEPEEDDRRYAIDFFNQMNAPHHHDMHLIPPMPHMQHHQHDPRHYYPPNAFGNYYDYSRHHQRQQQSREHPFRYPGYDG